MISRVLGLVRDASLAALIPIHAQDAFLAALTLPSTFRQLFAEGTLSSALIPILTRTKKEDGEQAAREAAWAIIRGMVVAIGSFCMVAMAFAPWYAPLVWPGWWDAPDKLNLATSLLQIMFPFLFFVSLAAWCMGVLNLFNIFFLPAVTPAVFNLTIIAGLFVSYGWLPADRRVYWVSVAVVCGGLFQFWMQAAAIRKVGFSPKWIGPIIQPRTIQFVRAAAPAIFGLAIYQLNIIVNRMVFGSQLEEGTLSSLFYAFHLMQFPQGVLGVAIASAVFPRISSSVEQGDQKETSRTVRRALELMFVLMIPATVGLVLCAEDLSWAAYGRGEFAREGGMALVVPALYAYCAGLISFSATKLAAQLSYAHHDFRTPVYTALASFVVNVGFCTLSVNVFQWPGWGLAAASSIASVFQLVLLLIVQRKRLIGFEPGQLVVITVRVLIASAVMGAAVWLVIAYLPLGTSMSSRIARLGVSVTTGILVYAGAGMILFRQDLMAAFRPKKGKKE